jgi:hypothetical protein
MTSTTVTLKEYNRLYIHGWREVGSRSGMTYRTEYYLDLHGPGGKCVRLGRSATKDAVLAMADSIGEFADLSVVDGTYKPADIRRLGGGFLRDVIGSVLNSAKEDLETVHN